MGDICKKELSKGNSSTTLKRYPQMHNIFFDSQQDQIPKKRKHSEEEQEKKAMLLTKAIVSANLSFSVVENQDFQEFITSLDDMFTLPCRKTIPKKIDKLYNETHQCMMNILNQCYKIAISTDLWTSNSTGIPLIAIANHFYQEIMNIKKFY